MAYKRHDPRGRGHHGKRPSSGERMPPRREAPPRPASIDQLDTGRESDYLSSLMGTDLELMVVLRQGEQIAGQLVWYDLACLKLAPSDGSPSLLIPKANIKYLYEIAAS
jgi:hypothetical protein